MQPDIELSKYFQESALLKAEQEGINKRQKKDLNNIALGFGSYQEMRSGIYETKSEEFKRLKKNYIKGFLLLTEYFETLWD